MGAVVGSDHDQFDKVLQRIGFRSPSSHTAIPSCPGLNRTSWWQLWTWREESGSLRIRPLPVLALSAVAVAAVVVAVDIGLYAPASVVFGVPRHNRKLPCTLHTALMRFSHTPHRKKAKYPPCSLRLWRLLIRVREYNRSSPEGYVLFMHTNASVHRDGNIQCV